LKVKKVNLNKINNKEKKEEKYKRNKSKILFLFKKAAKKKLEIL